MENLIGFPDDSRVWVYQADKTVDAGIVEDVNKYIRRFTTEWTSHSYDVHATGGLLHNRFVILVANEPKSGVSGCSIDSSVKFLRQLGAHCQVDFMDRVNFAYLEGETVHTVHMHDLADLYAKGDIDDSTMFFDNLVANKADFVSSWVKPLGDSWMKRFV